MPDPTPRFVIEHRSRGVYIGFQRHRSKTEWVPKFRYSILRTDPGVRLFYDEQQAIRELRKVSEQVKACYIVKLGGRR